MKPLIALAVLSFVALPAGAQSLAIPGVKTGKPTTGTYRCPTGKPFTVSYWNGDNGQSFALLPIDGKPTLLVSLISGSGVRYAAGSVIWWTKGRHADLYNAGMDPDAGRVKPVTCSESPGA
jgi:membrane-bound inhibitor of C-type lysozyme